MAKKLSEQLADLAVRAKHTEDATAAAEKEAHDKIVARKEQARAAATTAVEKVNQEIKTVNSNTARDWTALKADVAHAKHDRDVKRAQNRAEQLEWEAGFAIDYAIASVEQAGLAVLNAIDGRVQAEQAKQA